MPIKAIKRGKNLELIQELNIPDGQEIFIEFTDDQLRSFIEGQAEQQSKKIRPSLFGSAKGLITISDDFDEPMELVLSSLVKHDRDSLIN